ncbi:hypothetical protein CY0110_19007 [Crocosphaera chwakensis CCY0110]|uniref:Uncharacterized protein n=1 Tax=Crocosphaera chwakensis CCY0110 TaxID=391612 RepID=A3IJD3_9CHRO|nr:hypothetical protein CY0110_19007 [Crocosphaera chwakensis CCY0110]
MMDFDIFYGLTAIFNNNGCITCFS